MTFTNGKNILDPIMKSGPEQERAVFEAFNKAATGHDYNIVAGAAMNLLANTVRQSCATRQQAERMYDELVGRTKNLLLEKHYDPVSSKRRHVFPHTQVVNAELVHWDESKNK